MSDGKILVLGAGGYIGETTVREALAAGRRVVGLVRREASAARLRAVGAEAWVGDVGQPRTWQAALADVDAVVDLVQPPLPKRISVRALEAIGRERVVLTRAIVAAVRSRRAEEPPLLRSVGGCDELAATNGVLDDDAPWRSPPRGGGRIGLPVHEVLAASGLPVGSVFLGMVYGAGKAFASTILPGLEMGSFPVIRAGHNRLPLVHVEDAARAVLSIAAMGQRASGRRVAVAHPCGTTSSAFFDAIAKALGARPPRHLPAWLVSLVAGAGVVDLMTVDARVKPKGLADSGYSFRYRTVDDGVAAMVDAYLARRDGGPLGARERESANE